MSRCCTLLIILAVALEICFVELAEAYRFAWRTDTKVFPYSEFPPPSIIDNGDNGGEIIDEIVPK